MTVIEAGGGKDTPEVCQWLVEHGVNPSNTFKVEIEDEQMVVHQYGLNDDGAKYVHKDDANHPNYGEVAKLDPFTVAVKSPPPELAEAA